MLLRCLHSDQGPSRDLEEELEQNRGKVARKGDVPYGQDRTGVPLTPPAQQQPGHEVSESKVGLVGPHQCDGSRYLMTPTCSGEDLLRQHWTLARGAL